MMKNISFINNVWVERINPNITEEERIILPNREKNNKVNNEHKQIRF